MNTMSLREKAVLATVGMVLLYALAVALWFTTQSAAWAKSAKAYARAKATYESECRLIGEKAKWNQAYEDEKALMPTFEAGKATDTTWLGKMDSLAAKHHISISQRQSGKETEILLNDKFTSNFENEYFNKVLDVMDGEGSPMFAFTGEDK